MSDSKHEELFFCDLCQRYFTASQVTNNTHRLIIWNDYRVLTNAAQTAYEYVDHPVKKVER